MLRKCEPACPSLSLSLLIWSLKWPGDKFKSLHSLSCRTAAGCGESSLRTGKACGGGARAERDLRCELELRMGDGWNGQRPCVGS